MDWEPIETAPKDGTTIRVRQGEWSPVHAYWRHGQWWAIEYHGCPRPTHWMPLADAPATLKAQSPETAGE